MVRLVRLMVGAAVGAAGALYFSRRRGGELHEHAGTRVREFMRGQRANAPAFRPRSRRRPARGLLLPLGLRTRTSPPRLGARRWRRAGAAPGRPAVRAAGRRSRPTAGAASALQRRRSPI